MISHLIKLLLVMCIAWAMPSYADDFTIGYLQLEKDARYSKKQSFARYLLGSLGRPYAGAEVALKESKFHASGIGATFKLEQVKGKDHAALLASLKEMHAKGVQFFLLDLPADAVHEIATATKGQNLILFNVSAREDRLRQEQCQAHLLHTIPNYAMLTDALAQYLVFRKWKEILVLSGQGVDDLELNQSFKRSAKRYGLDIDEERPFALGNDPRQRDQNNISLLTADADYDVIFIADTQGEFARAVPYASIKPQLVVGAEGLAPVAWHWAWERHGAPQLENRFEDKANRPMRDADWAAWMAVKAIAEAVQRTQSRDFVVLSKHLYSEDLVLDGFKGNRLNFRPWDKQLRQPLLLATHNWVVERAPLDGFLHQTNTLDALGFDQPESKCKF